MDRRKFIKKSGNLSMAVAGLPLAKKLLTKNEFDHIMSAEKLTGPTLMDKKLKLDLQTRLSLNRKA